VRSLFECKFAAADVEAVQAVLAAEDIKSLDDVLAVPQEARACCLEGCFSFDYRWRLAGRDGSGEAALEASANEARAVLARTCPG
jgi:hypothetical protein